MLKKVLALLFVSLPLLAQSNPGVSIGASIGVTGGQSLTGQTNITMTDANYTMAPIEWWAGTLVVTSSGSLTATRNLISPANKGQAYCVENATTGGQSIQVIASTGTGTVIPNSTTSATCVRFDGTNYVMEGSSALTLPANAPFIYTNGSGTPLAGGYVPSDSTLTGHAYGVITIGPSTCHGVGTSQPKYIVGSLFANDLTGPPANWCVSGEYSTGLAPQTWHNFLPGNFPYLPFVDIDGYTNDVDSTTTGSQQNAYLSLGAIFFHMNLAANEIMASNATATGTWAALTTLSSLSLANAPGTSTLGLSGTGRTSTTSGSRLVFGPFPAGSKYEITWEPTDASTGGTFTVTGPSGLETNYCTGTTTFLGGGCTTIGRNGGVGAFAQMFNGNPSSTYNVQVDVTSATGAANIVNILAVAAVPSTTTNMPYTAVEGVAKQQADANSAGTTAYNNLASAFFTSIHPYFPKAFFVNPQVAVGGVRATNTTTDYVACPGCLGAPGGKHFSDPGYVAKTQLTEAYAVNAGFTSLFQKGIGAEKPWMSGPIVTAPDTLPNDMSLYWRTNGGGVADPTHRGTGICFFANTTTSAINPQNCPNAIGYEWSPQIGAYVTKLSGIVSVGMAMSNSGIASDTDNFQFWNNTAGLFASKPIHCGSKGFQGSLMSVQFPCLTIDDIVASNADANLTHMQTFVDSSGGNRSYQVPLCKGQLIFGNEKMWVYKYSSDHNNISFTVGSTSGDSINGVTYPSSLTFTDLPQNSEIDLTCNSNVTAGSTWTANVHLATVPLTSASTLTTNTIPKATGAHSLGNSSITDDGTAVTVGDGTLNVGQLTLTANNEINIANSEIAFNFAGTANANFHFFNGGGTGVATISGTDGSYTTTGTLSGGTLAVTGTTATVNSKNICLQDGTNCPATGGLVITDTTGFAYTGGKLVQQNGDLDVSGNATIAFTGSAVWTGSAYTCWANDATTGLPLTQGTKTSTSLDLSGGTASGLYSLMCMGH